MMFEYIKLIRPINVIITAASVMIAILICIEKLPGVYSILLAMLSAAFSSAAGNVINDIVDVNIDKISHPERALASNSISIRNARSFYYVLVFASLLSAYQININSFILVLAANILLLLYSYFLKKIPLIGNLIVAILTGLTFIFGGLVVNNVGSAILPAVFALLLNFIREIVKDIQDAEGDSKNNVITFPIKFGFANAKRVILLISLFLITLTFIPFIYQFYKIEFFIVVMLVVNPMIVYTIKSLFENHSNVNLKKLSGLLKLAMVFGLAAIYFGK